MKNRIDRPFAPVFLLLCVSLLATACDNKEFSERGRPLDPALRPPPSTPASIHPATHVDRISAEIKADREALPEDKNAFVDLKDEMKDKLRAGWPTSRAPREVSAADREADASFERFLAQNPDVDPAERAQVKSELLKPQLQKPSSATPIQALSEAPPEALAIIEAQEAKQSQKSGGAR